MAQVTVRETGGDYATLGAACAASETDILIDQAWANPDTSNPVVGVATTILVQGAAYHPGYIELNPTTYRLHPQAGNGITGNADLTATGLVIKSPTDAAPAIYQPAGVLTLNDSILYSDQPFVDGQDGLYIATTGSLIATNCFVSGFNRAGILIHHGTSADINSCTVYGCGRSTHTTAAGGIRVLQDGSVVRVFNSAVVGNTIGTSAGDYFNDGTGTLTTEDCFDSDGTLSAQTSTNPLTATPTDNMTPGAGSWAIFKLISQTPYDLRVVGDPTLNRLIDATAKTSGAGLTMPARDIIGAPRPTNVLYDAGGFEAAAYVPPASALTIDSGTGVVTFNGTANYGQDPSNQFRATDSRGFIADVLVSNAVAPPTSSYEAGLAFPTAAGFGRFATGGRDGGVYAVTSTSTSSAVQGSLAYGLANAPRPCSFVFDVGGSIEGGVNLGNGGITVAAQTAPSSGVQIIKGALVARPGSGNTIVRHLKVRRGGNLGAAGDAANLSKTSNGLDATMVGYIFDHCSFSWGSDENFDISGLQDVTVQYCLNSEALRGSNDLGSTSAGHAMLVTWFAHNITVYKCLFSSNYNRHPQMNMGNVQFVNNVVYNSVTNAIFKPDDQGIGAGDTEGAQLDFYGNYHKTGSAGVGYSVDVIGKDSSNVDGPAYDVSSLFVKDNIHTTYRPTNSGPEDAVVAYLSGSTNGILVPSAIMPLLEYLDPTEVYSAVLANNGAQVPVIDSQDQRVRDSVANSTGVIVQDESDVGGYTSLPAASRPVDFYPAGLRQLDAGFDGCPEAWRVGKGLDTVTSLKGKYPTIGNPTVLLSKGQPGASQWEVLEHYTNPLAGDPDVWGIA